VKAVGLKSEIRDLKTLPVTPVTFATDGTTPLVEAMLIALRLEPASLAAAIPGSKRPKARTHIIIFRIRISFLCLNSDNMRSHWKRTHVEDFHSILN
jgi:hypothetical protein